MRPKAASPRARSRAALAIPLLTLALVAGCSSQPTGNGDGTPSSAAESASTVPAGRAGTPHPWGETRRYVYGSDPAQTYGDLYLPDREPADGRLPLVVFIHGGSWAKGLDNRATASQAASLREAGVAVWNIEYRRVGTGGGWPTTFQDAADAFDHILELKKSVPALDTDNVIVSGHSAGGQLAAWIAARVVLEPEEVGSNPRVLPRGLVTINGVLSMADSALARRGGSKKILGGLPDDVPDRYMSVDPYDLFSHTADAIIVQGGADTLVPPTQGDDYVRAVNHYSTTNKAALLTIPEADHGSTMSTQWPRVRDIIVTFATRGFDAASRGLPRPSY